MSYTGKLQLLYELRCSTCKNFFVYCSRSRGDFRCYKCKAGHGTLEDVEKELAEMPEEELAEFKKEIAEYEAEQKKSKK